MALRCSKGGKGEKDRIRGENIEPRASPGTDVACGALDLSLICLRKVTADNVATFPCHTVVCNFCCYNACINTFKMIYCCRGAIDSLITSHVKSPYYNPHVLGLSAFCVFRL